MLEFLQSTPAQVKVPSVHMPCCDNETQFAVPLMIFFVDKGAGV